MDELEEVTQRFTADVAAYVDEVKRAADDARKFADDSKAAADATSDLRDKAAEAGTELGHLRDEALEAAAAEKRLDDDSRSLNINLSGLKSRLSGLGGAAASLTGIGDAMTAASGDASMFSRVMGGVGLATGLLEAPLSGLVVIAGGLVSGLAAAGAGLGAFGLVAESNIKAAATAANAVQNAQIAYNSAIATGTKRSVAYAAEQKAIMTAYAQLSPAQIAMSQQIGNVQNAWQSFVQSNTAGVDKILTQGIGLVPKLFAAMQQFMGPVEKALGGLVTQLGHGLDSSGFKSFISMLASNSGPAITKIGDAIGHIVVGLGGIIRAFMPVSQTVLGGLDKMTGAFARWASTLSGHSGFQSLMSEAKTEAPIFAKDLGNIALAIAHIASAMAGLATGSNSKTLLQVLTPFSGLLANLSKNQDLDRAVLYTLALVDAGKKLKGAFDGLQQFLGFAHSGASVLEDFRAGFSNSAAAASAATGIFGTLGGKLAAVTGMIREQGLASTIAAGATRVWTGIQAAFDAVMDANPIMLVVIAIAAIVAAVVLAYTHFAGFRNLVSHVFHDLVTWAKDALDWVKGHWPLLLAILTGPIGMATLFIVTHWRQIVDGAEQMFHDVVSFFTQLPGRIVSAVGDLSHLLWSAGWNLMVGLYNGIVGMAGQVLGYIEHLGSDISNVFSSVLHILSPSRVFYQHGVNTLQGYINGIKATAPAVRAAMASVGGQVAAGGLGTGAAGGASGSPSVHVTVPVTLQGNAQLMYNSPQFYQYLQTIVQEAVLRWGTSNPGTGFVLPGRA